jgi:hypothetical protein
MSANISGSYLACFQQLDARLEQCLEEEVP